MHEVGKFTLSGAPDITSCLDNYILSIFNYLGSHIANARRFLTP